jgi:Protein of unknown function (DUF2510)
MAALIFMCVVCAVIGGMIGTNRRMGGGTGAAWGALLGIIGIIIVAVSSKLSTLDRVETRPSMAGWHQDPLARFDSRYYDGRKWTQHVGRIDGDRRLQLEDPL